jgi:hypothetical protein
MRELLIHSRRRGKAKNGGSKKIKLDKYNESACETCVAVIALGRVNLIQTRLQQFEFYLCEYKA